MSYNGSEGNAIVSGNVGGGRQFRGVVPYGSSYYTRSGTTSSVDSFLRRAGGNPMTQDRGSGNQGYYYDPRRTVASTAGRDAQGGFVAPLTPLRNGPASSTSAATSTYLPLPANSQLSLQQRPLSVPPSELTLILQRQMKQTQADVLLRDRLKDTTLDKKITPDKNTDPSRPESLLPLLEQENSADKLKNESKNELKNDAENKPEEKKVQPNRYEQLRVKMAEDSKLQEEEAVRQKETEAKQIARDTGIEGSLANASNPRGRYKTFISLAEAKAVEYKAAAQQFLKEGKYYKAADSFALAAVWQPDDAATYVGQVWSLFAAGEYMSSAYYLNQILILKPQLAVQKIDLTTLMSDRDIFESRIIEITDCQQRNQSGELAFLMAYMYWQDGKPVKARETIADAVALLPGSPAVKTLADVISPAAPAPQVPAMQSQPQEPNVAIVPDNTAKDPNQP
jgi:tetratricopeptide (TPR) repeat protein